MAIGIDPTVDFACKRVLGSPDHPAVTLHFLNAVLRFPSPIRDVQILNPTIEKGFPKYVPPSDNRMIDDPIEQ